jgi:predicted GTPase
MKIHKLNVDEVEIHELAHLTPTMTDARFKALKNSIAELGQKLPIIMYRGKCIDGRHRVKAFRELGLTEIDAISENSQMSMDDIKEVVLNGYEQRRHQTPTQSAIMAYREWEGYKRSGEKVNQGAIAEKYGVSLKLLSRAKQLHALAGDRIVERLFQGNKINIGTEHQPNNTDSLHSLINYFSKQTEMIVAQSDNSTISDDYTDEESFRLNETISKLEFEFSGRMLSELSNRLYRKVQSKTVIDEVF